MATKGIKIRKVWTSLTLRVLLLLTLTMAPIGTIALYQTSRLSQTLEEQARASLIAATLESVTAERVALERAIGSAEALSLATAHGWSQEVSCTKAFGDVISGQDGYRFAGIVTRDGLTCATGAHRREIEAFAGDAAFSGTSPFVVTELGADDAVTALVAHPVERNGAVLHYVLLELTSATFPVTQPATGREPDLVALLSSGGKIVRASADEAQLAEAMPSGGNLSTENIGGGQVHFLTSVAGVERVYSIAPLYRNALYVVAAWHPGALPMAGSGPYFAAWLFPILMWMATLIVTYFAMNRLMMRHVRHLGLQMRRFARNKSVPAVDIVGRQPVEFSEMTENFRAMARDILQDEAELEKALHEKTLLLREVHHRVKNNLQLIASITNMQIRRSENPEAIDVLRRLQDRVLGLAAVHRQMYRAEALDAVPAQEIVETILDQIVRAVPTHKVTFDGESRPITLVPEQAVPFSLLFAEAATNAVSHLGTSGHGERAIDVVLRLDDAGDLQVVVSNTLTPERAQELSAGGISPSEKGLGSQLIEAFSGQLNGNVSAGVVDGRYVLDLRFHRKHARGAVDADPERSGEGSEPGFPTSSAASAPT